MLEELCFVSHELLVDNRPFWHLRNVGQNNVGGLATRYGLDSTGVESWWGRHFRHPYRPTLGPTSLLYNANGVSFPGRSGCSAALTTDAHIAPMLKKEKCTSLPSCRLVHNPCMEQKDIESPKNRFWDPKFSMYSEVTFQAPYQNP